MKNNLFYNKIILTFVSNKNINNKNYYYESGINRKTLKNYSIS